MMSYLHNNITSKSRVTVESINQFLLGIVGFLFSILMSILLKFMSLNVMYITIGSIIILFETLSIIKFNRKKMNNICVNLYVIKFEFLCKICYNNSNIFCCLWNKQISEA